MALSHDSKSEKDVEIGGAGSEADVFAALVQEEADHDIKYRTLSWQKTAILLFGEYVCLAILALAWSWSVLGWVAGVFITAGMGIITWYTSYILWQFCMKHPEAHDICDIAAILFPWIPRIAFEFTAFMLLCNNILIIGFHVFTGAKIFNTLSDSGACTVVFQAVSAIIGIIVSLPRTLNHVSTMSIVSACAMFIAILLSLVYAGIEPHPGYGYGGSYPKLGEVKTSVGIPGELSFVDGLNAVLNITFLWIGQILYPSFIAEMKEPKDFPKALALLTGMEVTLFTITAAVGYHFMGQYSTAPSIGSLLEPWQRKSAFAFVLIPTIVIGTIYGNIAAKFIFKRIVPKDSKHHHSHTVYGWGLWIAIDVGIWTIGFLLGNVIPSMGDFLGICCAAFDSFFGFIFWAMAYFQMNKGRLFATPKKTLQTIANILIFALGLFMLGPGLYTSVQAVVTAYAGGTRKAFSCASNSL